MELLQKSFNAAYRGGLGSLHGNSFDKREDEKIFFLSHVVPQLNIFLFSVLLFLASCNVFKRLSMIQPNEFGKYRSQRS